MAATAIKEFGERVCHYFRSFLETDFKRHQAPRRRIQLKNDAGFRTGFNLRKYPTLFQAAWALTTKVPADGLELKIAPRQHVASISPTLREIIGQQVRAIPSTRFEEVRADALRLAQRETALAGTNPEQFVETVQIQFAELISDRLVAPLLGGLEGVFKQQAYSAVESVFEIESDLVDALARPVVEQLPTALPAFVAQRDTQPLEDVLRDCFLESAVRDKIVEFFAEFATADAYAELRDLMQYLTTGHELQLYLYLGDMRFATQSYPLFYLPLAARLDENTAAYVLKVEPRTRSHLTARFNLNSTQALDYHLKPLRDADLLRQAVTEDGTIVFEWSNLFRRLPKSTIRAILEESHQPRPPKNAEKKRANE